MKILSTGLWAATAAVMIFAAGCNKSSPQTTDANVAPPAKAAASDAPATNPPASSGDAVLAAAQKTVGDTMPEPKDNIALTADSEKHQAVFAGGCFWCTEAVFQQLKGVSDVTSGYAGGSADTASYEIVSTGTTGHAESIRITYDGSKITFGELLRVFFATHDPTTLNRQGADTGTQYRSAIFYENDDQKRVAEAYIKQLTEAHVFDRPIVTQVVPLKGFYPAEAYHQDYAEHHPYQPYIQFHALPKVDKVRKEFPNDVKSESDTK